MSIDGAEKKRGRGRPKVDTEPVNVRASRDLLSAIDDWRERQPKKLNRPDAIRQIVSDRMLVEGFLPRFRAASKP